MVWCRVQPDPFAYRYPVVQHLFTILVFLHGISWQKSIGHKYNIRVYIWRLNSVPLISMFILSPVPHSLDDYSFMADFEIRKLSPPFFFFFFFLGLIWPSWESWIFIWILESVCLFLQKRQARFLIGIALSL